MDLRDKSDFINFLKEQAERYDKSLNNEKIDVWWKFMSVKYSLNEIKRAFELHLTDERQFHHWPTIVIIEKLIDTQLKAKGHRGLYACQMDAFGDDNAHCNAPAAHNMGTTSDSFFVCDAHYEFHREKADADKRMDAMCEDYEAKALKLGMTNRQYHYHLHGKEVSAVTSKEVQEIENREHFKDILKTYGARLEKKKKYRANPRDPYGGNA